MLRIFKNIVILVLISGIVACAAGPTSESTGQYLDSSAVTAKVKAELIDKLGAKGFAIKVNTFKGVVQLSGFVNNALTRQRAAAIASRVEGVKRIRNDLIIK
ncbi:BON domain-containing protein [Legionella jordanis]|uniref:Putative periplasmic or secreted lipoprotein n=1 Tax=Legionella jordanis TaxID=456 RepID=A0A0W0V8U5_9GAMM|nr:BON domain-containing protein [Legionella jordanis]KTD16563.1 putative periplasmic or secreted lipoprotein [Legionella jordanis]RMX03898.1 BON domain-containing protein [Legionella jordanis]RMX22037.1 BON domain-containing protein [Legionella jordanis]VEH11974.1 putative periplasmic or secreted lipoprotein [Legionella jordanis]HAT8712721.1 BON domain-containing protein [Legionella jordanis]